jgi:hypothetical protein
MEDFSPACGADLVLAPFVDEAVVLARLGEPSEVKAMRRTAAPREGGRARPYRADTETLGDG